MIRVNNNLNRQCSQKSRRRSTSFLALAPFRFSEGLYSPKLCMPRVGQDDTTNRSNRTHLQARSRGRVGVGVVRAGALAAVKSVAGLEGEAAAKKFVAAPIDLAVLCDPMAGPALEEMSLAWK